MSGGGQKTEYVQTQSSSSAPAYAQPYLEYGLQQAQQRYQSDQPQFYPGQTFVDFSPQTEQGLRSIENRAVAGSPLQGAANDTALATIRGDYLAQGNPYLDAAIQRVAEPIIGSTSAAFSGGGRFNSGLFGDQLAKRLADAGSEMAYRNYSAERNLQQQMVGAAPQIAAGDYADPTRLLAVGSAREGLAQNQLQSDIDRYNFEQNLPDAKLAQYMANVRGGTYGTTGLTSQPVFSNPTSSALGALSTLAGVGSLAFGSSANPGFLRGIF